MFTCAFKHVEGTSYVGAVIIRGLLDRGDNISQPCQVKHPLDAPEGRLQRFNIANISFDETETGMLFERQEIAQATAGQTVHGDYVMSARQQQLAQMAANKPGSPCHQSLHRSIPCPCTI